MFLEMLHVKKIYIFAIFAQIYFIIVKLITIVAFAYLRINTVTELQTMYNAIYLGVFNCIYYIETKGI